MKKDTNTISLSKLKEIINIIEVKNIKDDEVFDFIKLLKTQKETTKNKSVLFFPIYIDSSDDGGGWYIGKYDYRLKIKDYVEKYPNYTYVLDKKTYQSLKNHKIKIILVDDIMKSVDLLFNYFLKIRSFKTILVTGSVGKTTTVGLIENVIKDNVQRIYSKRITPIILKSRIINQLTENVDYLVLEASMYYKHHIKYFSDTLKPYISACINIVPEHIGIDDIKDVHDIVECKMRVFEFAEHALINCSDEELSKLHFQNGKLFYQKYNFDSNVKKVYDISRMNEKIKPYINTKLSNIQYQTAFQVGKILGIPEERIIERLNNAIPVEKRINKQIVYDREIVFDGDVSGVARFSRFTDHLYKRAVLVIRNLTREGEEKEDYSKIKKYFNRFEKVYLFNDIENIDDLITKNTEIVYSNKFIKQIDVEVKIFYHYGSYYRKFEDFDLRNLEVGNVKKKILLIHGWNYENYNNNIDTNAWSNRSKLVAALEEKYDIRKPDLPGFGLEKEPNKRFYTVDDYAKFINDYIINNNFHPDYILGYSFGGAVAVTYYKNYNRDSKLILVSPALIRNADRSKKYIKTPKFLNPIRNYIRNLYLIYKVKVPEMVYGTKFLKATYQSIVRTETIGYLQQIEKEKFIIIYGDQDNMVNPHRLYELSDKDIKKRIKFIKNGGHDIANTHTEQLMDIIDGFVNNN